MPASVVRNNRAEEKVRCAMFGPTNVAGQGTTSTTPYVLEISVFMTA